MADQKTSIILTAEDRTRAAFESAKNGLQGLEAAASRLPMIGASLAGLFSAGMFVEGVKGVIAFAASLDDMAEKTGASVETLSALSRVAKIGGHDMQQVETATIRLAKALAGADDEAKGAGHALETLGLNAKDLRAVDTGEALKLVADRLAEFKDGAGKTALAMDLFGKAGAQALPFLKDLAEEGQLVGKVTAEQAAQAERYEKNMNRLSASLSSTSKTIAMEMLPELEKLSSRLEQAFAEGAVNGFTSRWGAAFKGMAAGINEAMAASEEFLAKVTFGAVAENHYRQAIMYREAAKRIYADLASKAREERAALPEPTQSLSGYVSKLPTEKAAKPKKEKFQQSEDFLVAQRMAVGGPSASDVMRALHAEDQALERLRQKYVDLADPLQKYRDQLDEINRLRELGAAAGGLTEDQAIEAMWRVNEAMDEQIAKMNEVRDAGKDVFSDLERAIDGWGKSASAAFVDFAFGAKTSFADLVQSMVRDLAQMVVYENMMKPLFGSLGKFISAALPAFGGARAEGGAVFPGQYYVVGERGPEVLIPNTAGTVLPNGAASGGGVVVQIVEAPGKGGQVTTRSEGGRNIVQVMVEQVKSSIASDILTGNGQVPAAMQSTFGLNRAAGAF